MNMKTLIMSLLQFAISEFSDHEKMDTDGLRILLVMHEVALPGGQQSKIWSAEYIAMECMLSSRV